MNRIFLLLAVVTTEIQFVCNASVVNTNPKHTGNSGKTYTFELETPLACKMWPQECMVSCLATLLCAGVCWHHPVCRMNTKRMLQVLDRNGGRIDLSSLRKSSGNWVTKPSSTGVQYHINVCGPLNPVSGHNCSGM